MIVFWAQVIVLSACALGLAVFFLMMGMGLMWMRRSRKDEGDLERRVRDLEEKIDRLSRE